MSSHYRYGRRSYNRGSEIARRHIAEAGIFSREIGGTDKDVKEYFFSLKSVELEAVLTRYGNEYGSSAKEYAEKTYIRWKNNKTHMSGMVAKRLFDLLPPLMPISKKYELAGNIWKHFGPQSSEMFTIGVYTNIDKVAQLVSEKLDQTVTEYNIPEAVKNRFSWLASGDVKIKEDLLNHFRQLQKRLAVEKVKMEIPVLQRQARENPKVTESLKTILQIYKHSVTIWVDKRLSAEICQGRPPKTSSDNQSWWWILILIGLFIFFMSTIF